MNKMTPLRISWLSLAGLLAVLVSGCVQPASPPPVPGYFETLTRDDLLAKEPGMSDALIDASDGTSLLPGGTVLGYKTNTGLYGKLRIEKIDPDLNHQMTLAMVTFNPDGSAAVSRSALVIEGTWNAELDTGVQAEATDVDNYDFAWEISSDTVRRLVPYNGALFAIMEEGE